jgi:hypothetical protein
MPAQLNLSLIGSYFTLLDFSEEYVCPFRIHLLQRDVTILPCLRDAKISLHDLQNVAFIIYVAYRK